MLASRETIVQYIPQRQPMVMIHELSKADDLEAVTHLMVEDDNIFVRNGFFSASGMVENIAQTAAAQLGYQCARKNIPVPIGYIAAIKSLSIQSLPKENAMLTTSIRITNQVMDITVAEGKIEVDGEICCTCEMRIFVKPHQS